MGQSLEQGTVLEEGLILDKSFSLVESLTLEGLEQGTVLEGATWKRVLSWTRALLCWKATRWTRHLYQKIIWVKNVRAIVVCGFLMK